MSHNGFSGGPGLPSSARILGTREPGIHAVLPRRVSAFERDGKNLLSTVRPPPAMLGRFGVEGAEPLALQVEAIMLRIMEWARG